MPFYYQTTDQNAPFPRSLTSQDYADEDWLAHCAYERIAARDKEARRQEMLMVVRSDFHRAETLCPEEEQLEEDQLYDLIGDLVSPVIAVKVPFCVLLASVATVASNFLDLPAMIGITAVVSAKIFFQK